MNELRVSFADKTQQAGAVARAAEIVRREGVVVLDDLVDPASLERCRDEIDVRYAGYDQRDPERDYGRYEGRYTSPLVIDGALGDRDVFAPRPVLDLSSELLGSSAALLSLGLLVSLPGAEDQPQHLDGILFRETVLDRLLPPVALAFSLPLVRMDEVTGSTAFWRRSHRDPDAAAAPDFVPVVPVGSALFWDFRTLHAGLANRSDRPRPVIFSAHARGWYQEPEGEPSRHRRLAMTPAVREGLKPRLRHFTRRAEIVA